MDDKCIDPIENFAQNISRAARKNGIAVAIEIRKNRIKELQSETVDISEEIELLQRRMSRRYKELDLLSQQVTDLNTTLRNDHIDTDDCLL